MLAGDRWEVNNANKQAGGLITANCWARIRLNLCVSSIAEFFGTEEHVLRAKIEELKDNNCPLFR